MTLLVAIRGWTPDAWIERFRRLAPDLAVLDAREPYDPAEVTHAAVWKPEPGLLASLPNLRAIFNLGAGVDALFADPALPEVPIARIVDPNLTARMTEWVVMNRINLQFITTPRTVGRIPRQRLAPALPIFFRLCSSLPTSPMVARQSTWILRTSPERKRT